MKQFLLISFAVLLSVDGIGQAGFGPHYKPTNSNVPRSLIISMGFAWDNTVWLGTLDSGAVHFYPVLNYWHYYSPHYNNFPSFQVRAIAFASNNDNWFGTDTGLVRTNGAGWSVLTTANSNLPSNKINVIKRDLNNKMWVGTEGGLVSIDGNQMQVFTTDNSGLPSNKITSLHTVGSTLWIGTNQGLARYNGTNWTVFSTANGDFEYDQIFAIGSYNLDVFVRTPTQIYKLNGATWDTLPHDFGAPFLYNRSLAISSDGYLFMERGSEAFQWLNLNTGELRTFADSIDNNLMLTGHYNFPSLSVSGSGYKFSNIGVDANNTAWIASVTGDLVLYNPSGVPPFVAGENEINNTDNLLQVYPNPAANILHAGCPPGFSMSITDVSGKELLHISGNHETDISSLESGVYFVVATSPDRVLRNKFVKF